MRVVNVRNVAQAWRQLPTELLDAELLESRNGPVLVCPEPVTTVYTHPRERVLLDARRDANPFFHLVEALWMLAGRDDSGSLTPYVRDFGKYAEEYGEIHGAYGHRWRYHFGVDQLDNIVERLRRNPQDRQAVLVMWDPQSGFGGADDLEEVEWRDRPCNTHAYFRVRRVHTIRGGERNYDDVLDMTVLCRSNDMVFGGYGANAVHFSVLLEYMAARLGVEVGTYRQVSCNFHVYMDVWERKRHITHGATLPPETACAPMFIVPEMVDEDLARFFTWHGAIIRSSVSGEAFSMSIVPPRYDNPWFYDTAAAVVLAHAYYRDGALESALGMAEKISCDAWRTACVEWLQRRADRRQ